MKNPRKPSEQPVTTDRIESALDRLAIIMAVLGESGARYLPIYEKPESELAIYKAREAKMVETHERARRVKCKEVLP